MLWRKGFRRTKKVSCSRHRQAPRTQVVGTVSNGKTLNSKSSLNGRQCNEIKFEFSKRQQVSCDKLTGRRSSEA